MNSNSHNQLNQLAMDVQTSDLSENQQDHGRPLHACLTLNTIFVAVCHTSLFNYVSFVVMNHNSIPFDKLFKSSLEDCW